MRRCSRRTASRWRRRCRRTTRSPPRPRPTRSRSCSKALRSGSTTPRRRSPLSAAMRDGASAGAAAFAVADEHQGRGIGTRLLEQLALRASEVGIERFVAEVMPENRAMIGVFEGTGLEVTRELEGGVFEIRFLIAPTEQYRARIDERDHLAVTASLRPFLEPSSLAVIGASPRRGSIGGELFRNVLAADYVGAAYPVK